MATTVRLRSSTGSPTSSCAPLSCHRAGRRSDRSSTWVMPSATGSRRWPAEPQDLPGPDNGSGQAFTSSHPAAEVVAFYRESVRTRQCRAGHHAARHQARRAALRPPRRREHRLAQNHSPHDRRDRTPPRSPRRRARSSTAGPTSARAGRCPRVRHRERFRGRADRWEFDPAVAVPGGPFRLIGCIRSPASHRRRGQRPGFCHGSGHGWAKQEAPPETEGASHLRFYFVAGAGFEPATSGL
jgi:hypothetical protein